MAENGCVVFAKDVQRLSGFYQAVLNMKVTEVGKSHEVLNNGSIELVIHGISEKIASSITIASPPELRATSAIKPAFIVTSLEEVRAACEATGGGLKPKSSLWEFRGAYVLDGWDPEGNVVQFKQFSD